MLGYFKRTAFSSGRQTSELLMPTITLPDGSQRSFDNSVSIFDVANSIGPGLAKAALAGKIDGQLYDVSHVIAEDVALSIITSKDADGLEIIRHSTAHLLAQAAKEVFPDIKISIGPVIEDGFYYDFAFERTFTPEDLTALEKKMHEIAKRNETVVRLEMTREEALSFYESIGEEYKVQIIKDIPGDEPLSFYKQGDFVDLCRGPHVPRTGVIKVFKLTKLAGAYWRGDSNNEMLQRVYGTAWADKKDLKAYLTRLEEAEKRDHRKIGKQLDLFHLQEEAPGMVFWHPNGWTIYLEIEKFIRTLLNSDGYQEIKTPQVVDSELWRRSGHWDMYGENMFFTESEKRHYAIKPMSCPCHVEVFKQGIKSYKDLPFKLAEFGCCHRNEASGALHGLMRVRSFVQDDAHIFCTPGQLQQEALAFIKLLQKAYKAFGFTDIIVNLSTRPEKRIGDDALWDKSEGDLIDALNASGLEWSKQEGEGAFYGPKVDFSLKDCLGRIWQTGTLQLDYCLPERLGATYIEEDGSKQTPVMLHRAILGTIERFMGILIEDCAGKFPAWLAPIQVVVMNITDNQAQYCKKVVNSIKNAGFRVNLDLRNEKIGYKIREHTLQRVPYQIIVGDKELEKGSVSVRNLQGEDLGVMTVDDFVKRLESMCEV
jgi:threonyl-tRNA synthetase